MGPPIAAGSAFVPSLIPPPSIVPAVAVIASVPFFAHGILALCDEACHRRRELPAWERWSHPLDAFALALCYAIALFAPRTTGGLGLYVAAAILSSLGVTKDEWIHARHCTGTESWLHACLFLLHPVLLAIAGIWAFSPRILHDTGLGEAISGAVPGAGDARRVFGYCLGTQALLTAAYGVWQIAYWRGRPAGSRGGGARAGRGDSATGEG